MIHGFKNKNLNAKVIEKMFEQIIKILLKSSEQLLEDFQNENIKIANDENKIRDQLYLHYLDNNDFIINNNFTKFKFEREAVENYQKKGEVALGRVDLKVYNRNFFENRNAYAIVECKRLDGKSRLNSEYLKNGIYRFAVSPPLYSSYFQKNIMFGFIVNKEVSGQKLVAELNKLHDVEKKLNVKQKIEKVELCDYYSSIYNLENINELKLYHIFFDFSSILTK